MKKNVIPTEWNEDKDSNTEKHKKLTIWDFPKDIPECTLIENGKMYIGQYVFHCYTCGLFGNLGICLSCALRCHKDHDIVFDGFHQSFFCDCKTEGEITNQEDENEEQLEDNQQPNQQELPFTNVFEDNIVPIPNELLENREAGDDNAFLNFVNAIRLGTVRNNPANQLPNEQQNLRPIRTTRLHPGFQFRGRQFSNGNIFNPQRQNNQNSHNREQTNKIENTHKSKKQNQQPIDANTAFSLLKKFSFVHVLPPKPIVSRLSPNTDLKSTDFRKQKDDVPQNAHFKSTKIKLIQEPKNQILSRAPLYNYNCAGIVGNDLKFIVVCQPKKIKVYDLQKFELIQEHDVNIDIIMISISPLDTSVFAVASLHDVYIYRIEENGQVEQINKLELMLEAISNSLVIRSIEWVPFNSLHLAVTCSSFVKVYDIPTDCFSPIACISCNENIISSFIEEHN